MRTKGLGSEFKRGGKRGGKGSPTARGAKRTEEWCTSGGNLPPNRENQLEIRVLVSADRSENRGEGTGENCFARGLLPIIQSRKPLKGTGVQKGRGGIEERT